MKTITTTAIVALMTAAIGLTAVAPSYAQQAPAPMQSEANEDGPREFRLHHMGPRAGGDFLDFRGGVEGVEVALVRLSHRIELTAEQQPLFDAFKAAALAAAEDVSATLQSVRPAPAEGEVAERPDFSERLEDRIAIQGAMLAALEAVQPSATAFFDSLTDEQKAALTPQRPDRAGMPGMPGMGFGKDGPHHQRFEQENPAS